MIFRRLILLLLVIASLARATDAELTNYKSGIDLVWSGTKGTDYMEEYFYSDKTVCDRKVVYIKDTTSITMSHNARNVAFITTYNLPGAFNSGTFVNGETATQAGTGATIVIVGPQSSGNSLCASSLTGSPSQTGQYTGGTSGAKFTPTNFGTTWDYGIIGASDAYATIRYRVDRDLQWDYEFAVGDGSGTLLPAYSAPFTFASLTYDGSTPVVGTTGASTASALTTANAATYYWRGILDSVGDEWHSITVADDDSTNPGISSTNYERYASDGKVILFVVNPKTPGLTVRSTGNGQFYTTPPKQYFVPRIADQTTYFNAGTGSVTFEIRDINGGNIFYSINGGGTVSVGANNVTLSDSDFSTGTNTLQYWFNASYKKTRTIVKNPPFPSASETHGSLYISKSWATVLATIANASTEVHTWYVTSNTGANFYNARGYVDNNYLKGQRYGYTVDNYGHNDAALNCIAAKINGWDTTADGGTHSYGYYAKTQLLDNATSIDSVGLEKDQVGLPGAAAYHACLGSRENTIRGYYDVKTLGDMVLTYDLVAAEYTTAQNANGITAIEDYYIRDCIARSINEQIFNSNLGKTGGWAASGGMWDTARNGYAMMACYAIPTYSSPVFGTCGLDGNTTTYYYCPFPTVKYTWKQVLIDNNQTLTAFPNLYRRLGIEEYLIDSDGNMGTGIKASYFNFPLMGQALALCVNTAKINNPSLAWPNYDNYLVNSEQGTLHSVSVPEGNFQYTLPTNYNARFPLSAADGIAWTATQTTGTETAQATLVSSNAFGLLWWDDPLPLGGSNFGGKLTLGGLLITN
ncbi:MAG: hypothetical protein JSR30_00095 [Proteobacteria bacterium]|nr:hypothetical protein [Pseudomonadota bacterium]